MGLLIEKGKQQGSAAATVYRQSHVGRVADYPLMAAREGMIGLMTADSGRTTKKRRPVRRTRAPARHEPDLRRRAERPRGPLFIDMATSAVAAGKVELAAARGVPIPEGWGRRQRRQPRDGPERAARRGRRAAAARRL